MKVGEKGIHSSFESKIDKLVLRKAKSKLLNKKNT